MRSANGIVLPAVLMTFVGWIRSHEAAPTVRGATLQ
jgi:hypothetical protein